MPITLENWLKFAFAGDPPPNWQEATDVPLELQEELEAYLATSSNSPPQATSLDPAALPEPTEEDMQAGTLRRLKARLALREPKRKHPTPPQHAEHLEDAPLPDEGILSSMTEAEAARRVQRVAKMLSSKNQPPNPKPSLSKGSLQILQQFAADAQAKGPSEARSGQVPTPDWQTNRTGIPVSNPSPAKTSDKNPKDKGDE